MHAGQTAVLQSQRAAPPREPQAWAEESSFYLGPSLYTSPVVYRGMTVKEAWLKAQGLGLRRDPATLAVHGPADRPAIDDPLAPSPDVETRRFGSRAAGLIVTVARVRMTMPLPGSSPARYG